MDHFETDTVIAGAGVIGLAVARALALAGQEVIVIERETLIGSHTSSRNSEVIHAGIYYPQGSLKARMCVEGKHKLYEYCAARGLNHKRCGKLIVATTPEQVAELEGIKAKAAANGVDDLTFLNRDEALALEPHLKCDGALLSPSTGIIDSHGLMMSYQGEAEEHGGAIAFGTSIERVEVTGSGFTITTGGEAAAVVTAKRFINAAGPFAPGLADRIEGLAADHKPKAFYCKGNYYSLQGRAPFERLIYPVPEAAGLGVHLTLDLGGQARFGPDTEWVDGVEYSVDPARCDGFYDAIRRYWPGLKDASLVPAYAGIRPKLNAQGEPAADFRIDGPDAHGIAGLVNLLGIESPGLTSSLAIADEVAKQVG
ncbi:NAD(P)/FAD-dependent oxidoreductase [Pyruvatibacter sp.]|uniref:NAD(P)/FAD-dependent oxidoreductase n=1 Tax=Pyruvatibacter sp. TaxID=1981328 RepID=UPI0032647CDA